MWVSWDVRIRSRWWWVEWILKDVWVQLISRPEGIQVKFYKSGGLISQECLDSELSLSLAWSQSSPHHSIMRHPFQTYQRLHHHQKDTRLLHLIRFIISYLVPLHPPSQTLTRSDSVQRPLRYVQYCTVHRCHWWWWCHRWWQMRTIRSSKLETASWNCLRDVTDCDRYKGQCNFRSNSSQPRQSEPKSKLAQNECLRCPAADALSLWYNLDPLAKLLVCFDASDA